MKILEALVGIESYQIPQHHGYVILNVELENFDNLMACVQHQTYRDGNKIYFKSTDFAKSLLTGFVSSVQSLFVSGNEIHYKSLEFENLRQARQVFVSTQFLDRCLLEYEEMLKLSNEPIRKINPEIERKDWEDRMSCKIYCLYQLDSCLKIIQNKELPGDPLDINLMPDTKLIDRELDKMKKEIVKHKEKTVNFLDDTFVYRTLHSEYITIFNSKNIY